MHDNRKDRRRNGAEYQRSNPRTCANLARVWRTGPRADQSCEGNRSLTCMTTTSLRIEALADGRPRALFSSLPETQFFLFIVVNSDLPLRSRKELAENELPSFLKGTDIR